jgi:LPS export ABC transporter permease LptG/LPS export ABC transporter permease LptF
VQKIDKLLLRAVLPPFLIALAVLTFVVFVREIGRLSELLITRNASPGTIALLAGTILPGILMFSLPLSFLIGVLIGLSGLSGESQMIALQACGVPLRRVLRPMFALAAAVVCMTAVMSVIILPQSNDTLRLLKDRVSLRQAAAQVQPRVFNENFPNVVFYLDDLASDKQRWSRVFLADNSDPKSPKTVLARDGAWVADTRNFRLQLHLENGSIYEVDPENPAKDRISVFAATDIPIELNQAMSGSNEAVPSKARRAFEISTRELWRGLPETSPEERRQQQIELQRRLAIPFSALGFALVGVTLGVSTSKGGRTSGFILGLVIVLLFWTAFMNGLRLASVGKVPPWAGAWAANLLLGVLGLALLGRAERDAAWAQRPGLRRWSGQLQSLWRRISTENATQRIRSIDESLLVSLNRIISFPKVLDVYVSRGFLAYFLWSVVVCGALFVVLTLFDLLDDIIKNRAEFSSVAGYFFFLTPQILMLVAPMAVLLAVLINFGILEKHSEITALKAGGWSLYRIALPVFLIACGFCASLYLIQDYVLPYANIQQDALRNVIKGRPPRTSMRPQRKWIFGEANRIFNYDYFDSTRGMFVGLNVYEVDLENLKLVRRIRAARAQIQESGTWLLEDGWVRDFHGDNPGFARMTKAAFAFPEKAPYFQREIFEPQESSKLNYIELREYIRYLQKSGYNATELQVELHKKISFPLSCLVMALLGIPFSFSMGRKGAFFGITVSLVIAMSYWGIFSIFEQMGSYGFLAPVLAAWAPNLLFSAGGLALLFTIRT